MVLELILPKEAMAKLNLQERGSICLTDAPGGCTRMTTVTEGHETFVGQMNSAENVIRRYRNTLRDLTMPNGSMTTLFHR
mgnify:FL=1|jgi:hypothetical protein